MENETKGKTEVNDVKEIKDVKDYKDAKIKIDIDRYRVKEGDTINLKKFATYCDQDVDKSAVKNYAFPQALDEISLLQAKLFAQSTYGHHRPAGDGRCRQGQHNQARILSSRSERGPRRFLQAADRRGKGPRLHVAH